jgi:uncharacterized membrane protein YfcA
MTRFAPHRTFAPGLCGALVGFTLRLIGGGGSIIATPLLLYVDDGVEEVR